MGPIKPIILIKPNSGRVGRASLIGPEGLQGFVNQGGVRCVSIDLNALGI